MCKYRSISCHACNGFSLCHEERARAATPTRAASPRYQIHRYTHRVAAMSLSPMKSPTMSTWDDVVTRRRLQIKQKAPEVGHSTCASCTTRDHRCRRTYAAQQVSRLIVSSITPPLLLAARAMISRCRLSHNPHFAVFVSAQSQRGRGPRSRS